VWRHGSVVGSWLVDLTADALARSPELSEFSGRVSDSGEGRWTVEAAIDEGVPAPVISAALWQRFESRNQGEFTAKVLSAMRAEFGGHVEKKARSVHHELRDFTTPTAVAAAAADFVAERVRDVRSRRTASSPSP
jgi:6-phosphogluconate dehydrogenase